jgi:hypothetical protein
VIVESSSGRSRLLQRGTALVVTASRIMWVNDVTVALVASRGKQMRISDGLISGASRNRRLLSEFGFYWAGT